MAGFGKDGKGQILYDEVTISLGALGDNLAMKQTLPYVLEDDFRIIKMEWAGKMVGHTAGEGPMVIVLADNELTPTEIAEAVNASPVDRNDNVALERAHRPVFQLGLSAGNGTTDIISKGNGTEFMEKTIRWTFSNPEGFTMAVVNQSGGGFTIGTIFVLHCKYYGVWVT